MVKLNVRRELNFDFHISWLQTFQCCWKDEKTVIFEPVMNIVQLSSEIQWTNTWMLAYAITYC